MEHPRHTLRLYDYRGFNEEYLVFLAQRFNIPVVCNNYLSRKFGLPELGDENVRAHTVPNKKLFFQMHPSKARGFEFTYISSEDRKLIEYLIEILKLANRENPYQADRLMWRKENTCEHLKDQKLITINKVNNFLGGGIVLNENFEDINWSETEVPTIENKKHRPVLRTFLLYMYRDDYVSSIFRDESKRTKVFSYFENDLGQLDYVTSSGYRLRVIGQVSFFGKRFRLKPDEINKIKKHVKIQKMNLQYNRDRSSNVVVSYKDGTKAKKILNKGSLSDVVEFAPAIIMEGLFPFTMDENIPRTVFENLMKSHDGNIQPYQEENILTTTRLS